ncbi:glycosyltransferase [Yeosuana marina]|uniref:glycosyltransferase n=1 Tax=Yeosuana marina TaxID=1565536 RepID=UPI0030C7FE20
MKLVKELPKSLANSLYLHLVPTKFLYSSRKETLPVIVSMTSIPSRLNSIHLVIKSILNQTHKPKKIILWLHHDLKNKLPKRIKSLESSLFEIKYSHLTCSHRKLIHSLKEFPEDIIVTCDDDLIYNKHWLFKLYTEHLKHPKDIIANTTYQIKFDSEGKYKPYKEWKFKSDNANLLTYIPVGAWGILYPPKALSEIIFDEDLFLKLTPKADDLWFKAMALLKGTISRQSGNLPKEPIPIIGTQKVALKNDNVNKNKNDLQWEALSNHFNLYNILK